MRLFNKKTYLAFIITFCTNISLAQGEANFWHFGNNAGLNFNGGSPTAIDDGQINTHEGCSTISDEAGHLLFYTDGKKVWNRNHTVMPNGQELLGDFSSTQSALIIKKPGSSTNYYIFTTDAGGGTKGLNYSEIDMTLNAGLGDILYATKNTSLHNSTCEKITGIRHCNNRDIWIITHDYNSNQFRTFLVTPSGVNTIPKISAIGQINGDPPSGQMKGSPDGKHLALALPENSANTIFLYDFNNLTGTVNNENNLSVPSASVGICYGVEFSPDGTKLYGTFKSTASSTNSYSYYESSNNICQFDLCSNTSTMLFAPKWPLFDYLNNPIDIANLLIYNPAFTVELLNYWIDWNYRTNWQNWMNIGNWYNLFYANSINSSFGSMQLGPNGKIYITTPSNFYLTSTSTSYLTVINEPNTLGLGCFYTIESTTIPLIVGTNSSLGLPNFIPYYFKPVLPPFTTTVVNCSEVKFTPPIIGTSNCANAPSAITSTYWDFGDPESEADNISTNSNATHTYANAGIYSVTLILNYDCGSDTLKQDVAVTNCGLPIIKINPKVICQGTGTTITPITSVESPPFTYLWSPGGASTPTITVTPNTTTTYTVRVTDNITGVTVSDTTVITVLPKVSVNAGIDKSVCISETTTLNAIATGGDGNYYYLWLPNNSPTATTTISPTTNTTYSIVVSDGCHNNSDTSVINILTYPSFIPTFVTDTNSGCKSTCINFTNTTSNAFNNSVWNFGDGHESQNTNNTKHCFLKSGSYNIQLTVTDLNGCANTNTQSNYIKIHPTPKVEFNADPPKTSYLTPQIYFNNFSSDDVVKWDWFFGDPLNSTSSEKNPNFTYNEVGVFSVNLVATNNFNCIDTATNIIYIEQDYTIYMPSAFTPNDDDLNDFLTPKGFNLNTKCYNLKIFDRWGEKIFESSNINVGWNGKYKDSDELAKQDVYVWKIELCDFNNKTIIYTGHATLIN